MNSDNQSSTKTAHPRAKPRTVRQDQTGATSATRARPLYKWQGLLRGIDIHKNDPGWPNLLGQGYVALLKARVGDVLAIDRARLDARASKREEMATRDEANAFFAQAIAAVAAYVGPTSLAMNDYGTRPKRSRYGQAPPPPVIK
jgi:hypothetical protein